MKKIIFLLLFIFSFMFSSSSFADTIPENSHYFERCVKIANIEEFPDVYFLAFVQSPSGRDTEIYVIEKGECLQKGYKHNEFKILATKKSYLDSVGIKNIKIKKVPAVGECNGGCYRGELDDSNVFSSNIDNDSYIYNSYGDYIDKNNPLIKETIEYTVAGFLNNKVALYKSKRISEYNNGEPKKEEVFKEPSWNKKPDKSIAQQNQGQPSVKMGFWQKLVCFLKSIFGKSCK